jgi:hypothetical protein
MSLVFDTLQERAQESHEWCTELSLQPDSISSAPPLILDDVKRWNALYNESQSQEVIAGTVQSSSMSQCRLPPTTLCDKEKNDKLRGYSVIITFDPRVLRGTNGDVVDSSSPASPLRTLFVNILSLLTYPNAVDILVLYNDDHDPLTSIERDTYGKRLLTWNKDDSQPIRILFPSSPSMSKHQNLFRHVLFPYHPIVVKQVSQDVILYLNGNTPLVSLDGTFGGEESFAAGYELIRQNSRLLVGGEALELSTLNQNESKENATLSEGAGLNFSNNMFHDVDETSEVKSNFIPSCQLRRNVTVVKSSGLFLHREYSCLIWHGVFDPFQHFLSSIQQKLHGSSQQARLDLESLAVSALIPQLSGSRPLLYPMMKQTWSTSAKGSNEDLLQSSPVLKRRLSSRISVQNTGVDMKNQRRRRDIWEKSIHVQDSGYIGIDHDVRRKLESVRVRVQKTRPIEEREYVHTSLEEKLVQEEHLDARDVVSIKEYFGSTISGVKDWCSGTDFEPKREERSGCTIDRAEVSRKVLPWLNEDNKAC